MTTKEINVDKRGRITLPNAIREMAGIRPGDEIQFTRHPEGGILIERISADGARRAKPTKAA